MKKLRKIILIFAMFFCIIGCSSGTETEDGTAMPDLIGIAMNEAVKKLEDLGYTNVNVEKSDDFSNDSRFVVVSQTPEAGAKSAVSDAVKLICMKQYDLYMAVTSEKNLLFSKYDIDIFYDDIKIGSVDNGETFEKKITVLEGKHILTVQKHNDDDMKTEYEIDLKADTDLSFNVSHDRKGVTITDVKISEKEEVISRNTPAENDTDKETESASIRPYSTDYEDCEDVWVVEVGSYEFYVPGNWIDDGQYFYSDEDLVGAIVYYNVSETDGLTEQDIYDTVDGFTELEGVSDVRANEKIYVNKIKMGHAEFTQDQGVFTTRNDLYVFLDPDTAKSIVIMFMETDDSELDYSKDFDQIIHSLTPKKEAEKTMPEGTEFIFSTDVLEYSNKETDPLQFISSNTEGISFSTEDKLDLLKLGEQTITYTAVLGDIQTKVSHTFTIKDTKAPSIQIEAEAVTLEYGQSYDPYSNIKSVEDPVDGALTRVDSDPGKPEKGWYYLEGPKNISSAGYYDFTVHACDQHGNTSSRSFSVTMKEEVKAEPEVPRHTYILNIKSGKFHYPDCRDVGKMKDANKRVMENVTREEMIAAGYSSCGHCNP